MHSIGIRASCWGTAEEDCFQATRVSTAHPWYTRLIKSLPMRHSVLFCFVVCQCVRPLTGEVILQPGWFCPLGIIQICLKTQLRCNEILQYEVAAGLFLRILQDTVQPLITENYPVQNANGATGEQPDTECDTQLSSGLTPISTALGVTWTSMFFNLIINIAQR